MIDTASAHEASSSTLNKEEDLSELVGFRGLAFINNRRASRGEESNPLPPSWFTASDIAVDRLQKIRSTNDAVSNCRTARCSRRFRRAGSRNRSNHTGIPLSFGPPWCSVSFRVTCPETLRGLHHGPQSRPRRLEAAERQPTASPSCRTVR